MYPIAILIDELKHDDPSFRLNSVRRLDAIGVYFVTPRRSRIFTHTRVAVVLWVDSLQVAGKANHDHAVDWLSVVVVLCELAATALGPERTRNELLPFLAGTSSALHFTACFFPAL